MRFIAHIATNILLMLTLSVAWGGDSLAQKKNSKSHTIKTVKVNKKNGRYIEQYSVLAADTSIRHGNYKLIYKNNTIEKGDYKKGKKVGEWTYYNLVNEVEFKYDYDQNLPYQIMPHKGHTYNEKTFPSMYLGSPLVPYHFITSHIYYPVKESGNTQDCPVVLALEISATGRVTGYHLEVASREEFNRVVLAAAAQIPKDWRFVPAREKGKNVASTYCITLIFEAVD